MRVASGLRKQLRRQHRECARVRKRGARDSPREWHAWLLADVADVADMQSTWQSPHTNLHLGRKQTTATAAALTSRKQL